MTALRGHPAPPQTVTAERAQRQLAHHERAAQALDRRLTALERQADDLRRRVELVGRAIRWLPDQLAREGARARLLALQIGADVEPFAMLAATPDGEPRRPIIGPDVTERVEQVAALREQGLTTPQIAARLHVSAAQVRYAASVLAATEAEDVAQP
jgi:DNA-binding NarL/FixJ family response regulator